MAHVTLSLFFFFFNAPATTEIYTLSLHDALPISLPAPQRQQHADRHAHPRHRHGLTHHQRSEEHTSELQSRENLVCRLLLEKKKNTNNHSLPTNPPSSTAQTVVAHALRQPLAAQY